MVNSKVLAIAAVLIVVVAGAGAAIVLLKDDGSKDKSIDKTGRLMILGNADNNDVIDDDDVDTLEDIISAGTWDKTLYPYADANNDGSITQADVDMVEKILDKTVGYVHYVDCNGEIMDAHYPISKYVSVGTFAINTMIVLGQEKCVGISKSKSFKDEIYWTGIQDMTKISENAKKADYELVTAIPGVQAIFTGGDSVTENQADFEAADINVIHLDFNGENELAAIMIMGFLIDNKDKYLALAAKYDAVTDKVDEVLAKHPEVKNQKALVIYGESNNIYSSESAQGWMCKKIGLTNAWQYDKSLGDDKLYLAASSGGGEWFLNERFKADYIIAFANYNYTKDATADKLLSKMVVDFKNLDIFPDHAIIFNSTIPQFAKIAYMLEGLFPEDVGAGYGNGVLQDYIDTFNPAFSQTGYKVGEDGLFLVTTKEIQDYVKDHPVA